MTFNSKKKLNKSHDSRAPGGFSHSVFGKNCVLCIKKSFTEGNLESLLATLRRLPLRRPRTLHTDKPSHESRPSRHSQSGTIIPLVAVRHSGSADPCPRRLSSHSLHTLPAFGPSAAPTWTTRPNDRSTISRTRIPTAEEPGRWRTRGGARCKSRST